MDVEDGNPFVLTGSTREKRFILHAPEGTIVKDFILGPSQSQQEPR